MKQECVVNCYSAKLGSQLITLQLISIRLIYVVSRKSTLSYCSLKNLLHSIVFIALLIVSDLVKSFPVS